MKSLAATLSLLIAASGAAAFASGGPAGGTPDLRLPADIVYAREGHADSSVTFSHRTHVMLAEGRCTACHPALFPMLQRGPVPSHRAMNSGGSCGHCHDRTHAFGAADTSACGTCHTGPPAARVAANPAAPAGAAAAPRLPKAHTYPHADSPGPVTFRHETHAAGGCAGCHPRPFKMVAAAPLPDFGMHGAGACGLCHDGAKAFATDDPEHCSRCHRENGGGS